MPPVTKQPKSCVILCKVLGRLYAMVSLLGSVEVVTPSVSEVNEQ